MATSLLAKLKVNKPPAVKKDMEIRIKGKVNRADDIGKKNKGFDKFEEKEKDEAMEDNDEQQDEMGIIKKSPPQKPKVIFVDETKNKDFDRATFLKTFQRPKIVNELTPPLPPVVQQEQENKKDNKEYNK